MAQHIPVHRHVTPRQQLLVLRFDDLVERLDAEVTRFLVFGKENQPGAVVTEFRQGKTLFFGELDEKLMGELNLQTGPVPGAVVGAFRAAVGEAAKELE